MNPNAPSFGFNPAAAGFVPRFLQQQQQQQQEYDAYYNQGFTGFGRPATSECCAAHATSA